MIVVRLLFISLSEGWSFEDGHPVLSRLAAQLCLTSRAVTVAAGRCQSDLAGCVLAEVTGPNLG